MQESLRQMYTVLNQEEVASYLWRLVKNPIVQIAFWNPKEPTTEFILKITLHNIDFQEQTFSFSAGQLGHEIEIQTGHFLKIHIPHPSGGIFVGAQVLSLQDHNYNLKFSGYYYKTERREDDRLLAHPHRFLWLHLYYSSLPEESQESCHHDNVLPLNSKNHLLLNDEQEINNLLSDLKEESLKGSLFNSYFKSEQGVMKLRIMDLSFSGLSIVVSEFQWKKILAIKDGRALLGLKIDLEGEILDLATLDFSEIYHCDYVDAKIDPSFKAKKIGLNVSLNTEVQNWITDCLGEQILRVGLEL